MPPRPGHRLDLYLVPDGHRPLPPDAELHQVLESLGYARGREPGPREEALVAGGYAGVRVDRPEGERLYANGQGGFRVRCPETGRNVVPAFQEAVRAWRRGGTRSMDCPACGGRHDLSSLSFAPPAAFGRGAVVLVDAARSTLEPAGRRDLEAALGALVVVGSRR